MFYCYLTFLISSNSTSRCCLMSSVDEGVWKRWMSEIWIILREALKILTLRITWSKLISFFFGLDTGTSSLTVGLSNLFMKLSEILPGSNAVKPVKAMRGVRNVNKLDSECFACSRLFLHAGKCSIVHQIQGHESPCHVAFGWALGCCFWLYFIYIIYQMHPFKLSKYVMCVCHHCSLAAYHLV